MRLLRKNGDPVPSDSTKTKVEQQVMDYLISRGVDTSSLGEVPITRIIPTGRRDIGNPHGFAGAYIPSDSVGDMIALSPNRATDPQMRMEEVLHAMQNYQTINPNISGKIGKLSRMLGVDKSSPFEDQYAVIRGEGRDRDLEAEAKLTSLKIDLINQGVLNEGGEVSEEDLYKIQEYMTNQAGATQEQRSGAEYFLQPYFRNLEDDKIRQNLLKILNKI